MGAREGLIIGRNETQLSHLQFADDTVIFGSAKRKELETIKWVITIFADISGLEVNWSKSMAFGINLDTNDFNRIRSVIGCDIGTLPSIYLGLPIGANPRRKETWNPVITKIEQRLSSWKASSLSKAGRVVLIKAVLDTIPSYYLSMFKIPKTVLKKINSLQSNFLWANDEKRGLAMMKWSNLAKPKEQGGLGICDIEVKNAALLFKWWWKFADDDDKLWKKTICSVYGQPIEMPVSDPSWQVGRRKGIWNTIMSIGEWRSEFQLIMSSNLRWIVKNGTRVRFWQDRWLEVGVLKEVFPRLFSVSDVKTAVVGDVGLWNGVTWLWTLSWRRALFAYEAEEVNDLLAILNAANLTQASTDDKLGWLSGDKNSYSVKSFYCAVMQLETVNLPTWHQTYWKKWAPPRIELFVWFALNNRLATRDRLFGLNLVSVGNLMCLFCCRQVESADHLFLQCSHSNRLWNSLLLWWDVQLAWNVGVGESYERWISCEPSTKARRMWGGTYMFAMANIWFTRNKLLFEGVEPNWEQIAISTKMQVLEWCKLRSKLQGSMATLANTMRLKELF